MAFDPNTLSGLRNFNEDVYFNNKASFFESVTLQKDVTINGVTRTKEIIGSFTGNITGNVTGNITGNVTGNLTGNVNSSGLSTVTELRVLEALYDRNNDFGSAGQVLASDGTGLEWINTSDANVGSASNVGTNLNETNSNQFLTFVGASSGNNPIRIDSHLRYNPSTNTMSGINYSGVSTFTSVHITGQLRDGDGDFGTSGQVLASDGTNTNWVNAGTLTAGAAAEIGITAVDTDSSHFITFVDSSTGNDNAKVDTNLTYNPNSNTLSAGTFSGSFSGNGSNLNTLNASELDSGTVNVNRLGSSGTRNSTTFLRGDNTWQVVDTSVSVTQTSYSGTNPITTSGSDITIGTASNAYGRRTVSTSIPTTGGNDGDIVYVI